MHTSTRFKLLIETANQLVLQAPLFAILMGAAFGAIMYGGIMSSFTWLMGLADGTASWVALILGFPALFLIPSSIDETWSAQATLTLIFFVQGALFGGLIGLLARIMCINKFPQDDIEDVAELESSTQHTARTDNENLTLVKLQDKPAAPHHSPATHSPHPRA